MNCYSIFKLYIYILNEINENKPSTNRKEVTDIVASFLAKIKPMRKLL